MKDDGSRLPYEHTLSLNALFDPDGRAALGAGVDAVEAIFSEVQTVSLFVLDVNSMGVGQRSGQCGPVIAVTHVNARVITVKRPCLPAP